MKSMKFLCSLLSLTLFGLSSLFQTTRGQSVSLTLVPSAAAKGAVCLDGSVPAYHFLPGSGSGANSWIVDLEGGGWCNNVRTCAYRKNSRHGSSKYMAKTIQFSGILSSDPTQNPDFYNWNRVRINYCDGASFAGEGYDKDHDLYFRGQRIWSVMMDELLSKGMRSANQALLTGCSAGGLSSILHCDQFRAYFPASTKVKCLADAGFFIDTLDVGGGHTIRDLYQGVVTLQGAANNLPQSCTSKLDATSCFFPQNIVGNVQTPLFLLNSAYDVWQIMESLAPKKADPEGLWQACKSNHSKCNPDQLQVLQRFRNQMLADLQSFSKVNQNGLFINSCFTHCQSETSDTWYAANGPVVQNKGIGKSVGDWYFDRAQVKAIDCAYPCDQTCHHLY
ncbi:pectin acetylesterase 10 [Canna indica]|uniref:Pectin acetylesterase n=1 Tax=Canna indica TaxID=4628 RepID=A0AAQ3QTP9_9LILI|nr:pectin acetylesterase 10 [Canna indica]